MANRTLFLILLSWYLNISLVFQYLKRYLHKM